MYNLREFRTICEYLIIACVTRQIHMYGDTEMQYHSHTSNFHTHDLLFHASLPHTRVFEATRCGDALCFYLLYQGRNTHVQYQPGYQSPVITRLISVGLRLLPPIW